MFGTTKEELPEVKEGLTKKQAKELMEKLKDIRDKYNANNEELILIEKQLNHALL